MRRHSDLLEPCAGKLASTVLRGEGDSNVPALPDYWSTRMGRENDVMEIDHKIPKSQGGKDSHDNWELLHRHCHDTKTASDGSLGNKSGCNSAEPKPTKRLEKVADKWVMRYA
jgi:hypothetical protein